MVIIATILILFGMIAGGVATSHIFYRNMKEILDQAEQHSALYAALNEKLCLIMKEVDKYIIYHRSDKIDDPHKPCDNQPSNSMEQNNVQINNKTTQEDAKE